MRRLQRFSARVPGCIRDQLGRPDGHHGRSFGQRIVTPSADWPHVLTGALRSGQRLLCGSVDTRQRAVPQTGLDFVDGPSSRLRLRPPSNDHRPALTRHEPRFTQPAADADPRPRNRRNPARDVFCDQNLRLIITRHIEVARRQPERPRIRQSPSIRRGISPSHRRATQPRKPVPRSHSVRPRVPAALPTAPTQRCSRLSFREPRHPSVVQLHESNRVAKSEARERPDGHAQPRRRASAALQLTSSASKCGLSGQATRSAVTLNRRHARNPVPRSARSSGAMKRRRILQRTRRWFAGHGERQCGRAAMQRRSGLQRCRPSYRGIRSWHQFSRFGRFPNAPGKPLLATHAGSMFSRCRMRCAR